MLEYVCARSSEVSGVVSWQEDVPELARVVSSGAVMFYVGGS